MRRRIGQAVVLILTCGALGACGLLGPRVGTPSADEAYEGDLSIRGVTVAGRVNLIGPIPRPDPIPVYRDSDFCGEEMPNETLLVERGSQTVEGVVVSLEGITKGKPLPQDQTRIIESRGCRFIPRVSATAVGSLLAIQSVDPIMHNTHLRLNSRFGDTVLNVVQVAGAKGMQRRLLAPGLQDVRCDIHPFMRAFIHVFEHPYFSVTDAAGRYELTQVPPGTYRMKMWHEKAGVRERTITVPDQGPVTLDLELDLKPTAPQRLAPTY